MFDSILVVCVGNICRSPPAERQLKQLLPHKKIDLAGLSALVGTSADSNALNIALRNGSSFEGHVAKQLTSEMCRSFDMILVMENTHIKAVCRFVPEARARQC
ncbi:protein-tyrosine-phosphatase [Biostraticola tofi]|uniref:protein-tyrosine-phosphatase n=1 Tax=Biostraticola tofi TaxID=466109 RepID=A0A4R3Z348_9GAMM|nr:protein-tyrosine-phosphatase [Biostraticola tofi]